LPSTDEPPRSVGIAGRSSRGTSEHAQLRQLYRQAGVAHQPKPHRRSACSAGCQRIGNVIREGDASPGFHSRRAARTPELAAEAAVEGARPVKGPGLRRVRLFRADGTERRNRLERDVNTWSDRVNSRLEPKVALGAWIISSTSVLGGLEGVTSTLLPDESNELTSAM